MSKTLQKSVFIVVVITLITKVLGFLKQMVIAATFGASAYTDVFYLAFGLLTSITFAIFSALTVTFIPLYQREKTMDQGSPSNLVNRALIVFGIFSYLALFLIIIFSNELANLLLLSNGGLDHASVAYYIRLLSPLMIFSCVISVLGAVLEANKVFVYSKSSGITCSICVIGLTLIFSKYWGVKTLIYGTLLGYVIQIIILVVACRGRIKFQTVSPLIDTKIQKLLLLIFPLLVGNGIYEINKTVDKILSAGFAIGSTSSLSYAQTLFDSLCALTITTLVGVLFAYISEQVGKNDQKKVIEQINSSISILLLVTMPIAIMIFINGNAIVSIIYGRGAFDSDAVLVTTSILKGYAIGFPFLIFREILAKAHYAFQDSTSPMKNSIIAVVTNIILSVTLSKIIGVQGISYSTSASYIICSCLLLITIKKHINYSVFSNKVFYKKFLLASLIMTIMDLLLTLILDEGIIIAVVNMVISTFIYLLSLKILKCKELYGLDSILKRIKKEGH